MKTASWVLLALLGTATLLLSLLSAARAYGHFYVDRVGGMKASELAAGKPVVETAVRSRRATAAAYGAGFGMLFLLISVGPYRRGDVWAWWALLVGNTLALVSAITYDKIAHAIGPFELTEYLGLALVWLALAITVPVRLARRSMRTAA